MHILIVRRKHESFGEFGTMAIDAAPFCFTAEQPWNNNVQGASCMPFGDYELHPYDSPAHGSTVVFHNPALGIYGTPSLIPPGHSGRSLCEIHNANWPFQLRGCVAVGHELLDMPPHGLGVSASVETFDKLRARWGDRKNLTCSIQNAGA